MKYNRNNDLVDNIYQIISNSTTIDEILAFQKILLELYINDVFTTDNFQLLMNKSTDKIDDLLIAMLK